VQIINVQQTYDILVVIGSIPLWLRVRWCIPVNGDVYIVSLMLLPYLIHRSFWSNLSLIEAIKYHIHFTYLTSFISSCLRK